MKKVLLIGTTGATGRELLKLLVADELVGRIYILHYRPTGLVTHPKIIELIHDFDHLEDFKFPEVDSVFCCLGTTIKKAKSKEYFAKVDYLYVTQIAHFAKAKEFHVISALGANKNSPLFYNKTKGRMEEELKSIGLEKLYIYRPSLLLAKRDENFRPMEHIGQLLMRPLREIPFLWAQRMAPVTVKQLAQCMISNFHYGHSSLGIIPSQEISNVQELMA